MPTYVYNARDPKGQALTGNLEAVSEENALTMLQSKGFLVTAIQVQTSAGVPGASRRRKLHTRVALMDQIMFCRQLATLLNAGVPLLRCLEVLRNQMESRVFMQAMNRVIRDVESGSTFRDAMAKHPKIFNPFWLNLIETGEASGHLGDSMNHLAKFLERAKMLRDKLVSAMLYPMVLVVMGAAALGFFSIFVIPMFNSVFSQFSAELPIATRMVLGFGNWMKDHIVWIVLAVGLGIWGLRKFIRTPRGRAWWDTYSLRIPIIGTLLYNSQIARFSSGMGTLLESGVPILFGLEILERSADNVVFGEALSTIKTDVREGKPMATPMEATGLFPPMVVQMIQVGEEIGELGTMLQRITAYYEDLIDTLTERMAVLFEPIALVCVGSMIGFMVIALFLPLFSMASAIR